jgi:TPP-dependent pyruvate/acetoin dehydrogenase alpha subunit
MNMAAVWNLPVIFVLENNHYGVSTRIEEACKIEDLSIRAQGYGMPGVRVNGFDVLAVYQAARQAVECARQGGGPTLLVTESYRIDGHYAGEPEVYRTRSEVDEYRKREPIGQFRNHLLAQSKASKTELEAIEAEIKQEMVEAVAFAKNSPPPDPATAMQYIYA